MREILFRGRRLDGIWRCGDLVRTHPCECHIVTANLDDYNDIEICFDDFVDYKTVGQFTGLKDKNGKKIFEGDIVLRSGITWLIAFEKNAFVCKDNTMKTYFALWEQWEYNWKSADDISPSSAFEVIGNIYDSPELLV